MIKSYKKFLEENKSSASPENRAAFLKQRGDVKIADEPVTKAAPKTELDLFREKGFQVAEERKAGILKRFKKDELTVQEEFDRLTEKREEAGRRTVQGFTQSLRGGFHGNVGLSASIQNREFEAVDRILKDKNVSLSRLIKTREANIDKVDASFDESINEFIKLKQKEMKDEREFQFKTWKETVAQKAKQQDIDIKKGTLGISQAKAQLDISKQQVSIDKFNITEARLRENANKAALNTLSDDLFKMYQETGGEIAIGEYARLMAERGVVVDVNQMLKDKNEGVVFMDKVARGDPKALREWEMLTPSSRQHAINVGGQQHSIYYEAYNTSIVDGTTDDFIRKKQISSEIRTQERIEAIEIEAKKVESIVKYAIDNSLTIEQAEHNLFAELSPTTRASAVNSYLGALQAAVGSIDETALARLRDSENRVREIIKNEDLHTQSLFERGGVELVIKNGNINSMDMAILLRSARPIDEFLTDQEKKIKADYEKRMVWNVNLYPKKGNKDDSGVPEF